MINILRKLKERTADQYVWFLILFICLILIVSIFVMVFKFNIEINSIITNVEQTSDEVLAVIKRDYYQDYIISDNNLTVNQSAVTSSMVQTKLADALGAEVIEDTIELNLNGVNEYTIEDISFTNDDNCIYCNMSINIPIRANGAVVFNYTKDLSFASSLKAKEYY